MSQRKSPSGSHKVTAQERLAAAFRPHRREAHVPIVAPMPMIGLVQDPFASRYGGRPWMPDDMEWPTHNGLPMEFVLQLHVPDLPSGPIRDLLGGKGLLLFFYTNDFQPEYGRTTAEVYPSVVHLVDTGVPGAVRASPERDHLMKPLRIAEWRPVADHPDMTEFSPYEKNRLPLPERLQDIDPEDAFVEHLVDNPQAEGWEVTHVRCDKLGGWETWEQGIHRPVDRLGNTMRNVYQICYDGLIGEHGRNHTSPTWGSGNIFYSPQTGEFLYVWDCD